MSEPDETTFRSRRAAVVRPNRILVAIASLSAIGAIGVPLLLGTHGLPFGFPFAALGLAALFSLRERRWPRLERGTIEADAAGVKQDGKLVVAREAVTQGLALPVAGAGLVRLNRRWPRSPVDIVAWDEAEGRALLSALGLDAAQTAVDIPAASGHHLLSGLVKGAAVAGFVAAWFLINTVLIGLGLPFLVWLILFFVARGLMARNSTVRVGVDGVQFRWLWMREFTRFADVKAVRLIKKEKVQMVELLLHDGKTRHIPVAADNQADEESFAFRRIVQALELFRERRGAGEIEALARGAREPADWLRALRGLAAGANAGMRTAPVAIERLWAILDDPSAPSAARAGAAASLASTAGKKERERIRIAAATVAEPKLRVAIEKTIQDGASDDEIAEALAEVDAAVGATGAKRARS